MASGPPFNNITLKPACSSLLIQAGQSKEKKPGLDDGRNEQQQQRDYIPWTKWIH
jgi:hypothetical protein